MQFGGRDKKEKSKLHALKNYRIPKIKIPKKMFSDEKAIILCRKKRNQKRNVIHNKKRKRTRSELLDYKKLYEYIKSRIISGKWTYVFIDEIQTFSHVAINIKKTCIMKEVGVY